MVWCKRSVPSLLHPGSYDSDNGDLQTICISSISVILPKLIWEIFWNYHSAYYKSQKGITTSRMRYWYHVTSRWVQTIFIINTLAQHINQRCHCWRSHCAKWNPIDLNVASFDLPLLAPHRHLHMLFKMKQPQEFTIKHIYYHCFSFGNFQLSRARVSSAQNASPISGNQIQNWALHSVRTLL